MKKLIKKKRWKATLRFECFKSGATTWITATGRYPEDTPVARIDDDLLAKAWRKAPAGEWFPDLANYDGPVPVREGLGEGVSKTSQSETKV